jgi:hypothetical protein
MADKDDDLFDQVSAMADRLKLKGGERRKYIHDHMTRGGYRMEPSYVPDEDSDDNDDDNDTPFFSRQRHTRNSGSGRTRSRSRDSDDWY